MKEQNTTTTCAAASRPLLICLLGAALLLPLAALAWQQGGAAWAWSVLGLAELLLMLACWQLFQERQQARQQIQALQHNLINQRVTDPASGAALPDWFDKVLHSECRRAVREFAPLALMQLEVQARDPAQQGEAQHALAQMLTLELSRPGDLVGLTDEGAVQVLMPATNEQCRSFAQRCLQRAEGQLADAEVRVGVCVMQPVADLTPDKARQQLRRLMGRLQQEPAGSLGFEAEAAANDMTSPTYSL